MTTLIAYMLANLLLPPDYTETPEPNICSFWEGRYCISCGDPTNSLSPPCVGEDEGWLCCIGGYCVESSYDEECPGGDVGWCTNYFLETLANGIEVAHCEDQA